MFHVDEGAHPAKLLRLGDNVLANGGLSGRFRAVDFGDPPAGDPANAQRDVQRERSGRDRLHCQMIGFPKAHDRPFAETFADLAQGAVQRGLSSSIIHLYHMLTKCT